VPLALELEADHPWALERRGQQRFDDRPQRIGYKRGRHPYMNQPRLTYKSFERRSKEGHSSRHATAYLFHEKNPRKASPPNLEKT
jgi:hypothetical protein